MSNVNSLITNLEEKTLEELEADLNLNPNMDENKKLEAINNILEKLETNVDTNIENNDVLKQLSNKLEKFIQTYLNLELDPNDDKYVKKEVEFYKNTHLYLFYLNKEKNINIDYLIKYYDDSLNKFISLTDVLICTTRLKSLGISFNYQLDLDNEENKNSCISEMELEEILKDKIDYCSIKFQEIYNNIFVKDCEFTENFIANDFSNINKVFNNNLSVINSIDRDIVSFIDRKLNENNEIINYCTKV